MKRKIITLALCILLSLASACGKASDPSGQMTTAWNTEQYGTTTKKTEQRTERRTERIERRTERKTERKTEQKTEQKTVQITEQITEQKTVKSTEDRTEQPTAEKGTEPEYISPYHEEYGSAGNLEGTTLVISIVANDNSWSWAFTKEKDTEAAKTDRRFLLKHKDYLLTACDWLTLQASRYGKTATFIADWEMYPDLYYEASFKDDMVVVDGSKYSDQRSYILSKIPTNALKKKYMADNVIYIFFFNTTNENQINPWSLGFISGTQFDREIINLYTRFKTYTTKPGSYAHEMLHCFGAHDLYYASEAITQKYVDHLKAIDSKDIMYMVYDSDEIALSFTELDAYYVGLTDSCEDVEKWGLIPAARFQ